MHGILPDFSSGGNPIFCFSSLWLALFKEVNFAMILGSYFFSPASNIQRLPGITAISKKTDFKFVKYPKEYSFQIFTLNIQLVFYHILLTPVFTQNISEQNKTFLHVFHFREELLVQSRGVYCILREILSLKYNSFVTRHL